VFISISTSRYRSYWTGRGLGRVKIPWSTAPIIACYVGAVEAHTTSCHEATRDRHAQSILFRYDTKCNDIHPKPTYIEYKSFEIRVYLCLISS